MTWSVSPFARPDRLLQEVVQLAFPPGDLTPCLIGANSCLRSDNRIGNGNADCFQEFVIIANIVPRVIRF